MGESENKAVVEQLLEAFNASDWDKVESIVADDFTNHNPPPFPGIGADRAGMLAAMQGTRQGFPDARAEVLHAVADGDLVVLHDVVRGTHDGDWFGAIPATGKQAAIEFIHIFRIADGKIAERWGLVDVAGAMQQLGVAPPMGGE
jgi:steroid delta-isomerase-like uncharacterized protein